MSDLTNQYAPNTHFIGDPCYVLHTIEQEGVHLMDSAWVKGFCFAYEQASKSHLFDGHFEYMGHKVFVHSTAHGDGSYEGTDGRTYPVDAGLIGAIPLALIEDEVIKEKLKDPDVRAVSMTPSLFRRCDYESGTFTFHHTEGVLEIATDPEEEYECRTCGAELSEYEYHNFEVCNWCMEDEEL